MTLPHPFQASNLPSSLQIGEGKTSKASRGEVNFTKNVRTRNKLMGRLYRDLQKD